MDQIQKIVDGDYLLGIIIPALYRADGISFFTGDDSAQQIGYMHRPKGYDILPHVHNAVERTVSLTQEVLIVRSGKVRVDFYTRDRVYKESRILLPGDIVFLAGGGHGFKVIEECEMVEVKQGPYCGEKDKVRFPMIEDKLVIIK